MAMIRTLFCFCFFLESEYQAYGDASQHLCKVKRHAHLTSSRDKGDYDDHFKGSLGGVAYGKDQQNKPNTGLIS